MKNTRIVISTLIVTLTAMTWLSLPQWQSTTK